MGRRYRGDINGGLWFGIQATDDATYFGDTPVRRAYLAYCFRDDDWAGVAGALETCREHLGEYHGLLQSYFATHTSYNRGRLAAELGVSETTLTELLPWYARYELGRKILECIDEHGICSFEVEDG